jgi:hypothetical protein
MKLTAFFPAARRVDPLLEYSIWALGVPRKLVAFSQGSES